MTMQRATHPQPVPPPGGPAQLLGNQGIRLVLLLVLMAGCGKGEDLPPTAPVTGVVTYKGKTVDGATVMFFPINGARTNPGLGQTDKDGKYSLTTYAAFDGALLGDHEISVQLFEQATNVSAIPRKYTDAKTSGLKATVKEGENDVPINLQ